MPKGKDFCSLDEAVAENMATAKKLMTALEMMAETGEVFGRDHFRTLILDTANANIRYMRVLSAEVDTLRARA
jgi:predicted homoserine dehydrogenase-like protein